VFSCYHTQLTYLNGETHFGLFTGWILFVFEFIGFNLKYDGIEVKKSRNLVFFNDNFTCFQSRVYNNFHSQAF